MMDVEGSSSNGGGNQRWYFEAV
ncbi:hypothetical protein [Halocatena salina]